MRPLKVEVSEDIYTDTETIYLPERISSQISKKKILASLKQAQYICGHKLIMELGE